MKLISTYAPGIDTEDGKHVILSVFDTFVQGKSLVVGVTIGELRGNTIDDARTSAVGTHVLERLFEYHDFRGYKGPVVVAGVARKSTATQRVRDLLSNAADESAVALLCADDKVYDKAVAALQVNFEALKSETQ